MKIDLITRQNKRTTVEMFFVPRIGEEISVTNMTELYTDAKGNDDVDFGSPVWIVERVQYHCQNFQGCDDNNPNLYTGVLVYIKNEEED